MEEGLAAIGDEAPETRARANGDARGSPSSFRPAPSRCASRRKPSNLPGRRTTTRRWRTRSRRGRGHCAVAGSPTSCPGSCCSGSSTPRDATGRTGSSRRGTCSRAVVSKGDLAGGAAHYERVGAIPNSLQNWGQRGFAASCAIADGRFDGADELIEHVAAVGGALGDTSEACRCIQHIGLELKRARFDEAQGWVDRLSETAWGPVSAWRFAVMAARLATTWRPPTGSIASSSKRSPSRRWLSPSRSRTRPHWSSPGSAVRSAVARLRPDVERYAGLVVGNDVYVVGAGDREHRHHRPRRRERRRGGRGFESGLEQIDRLGLRALIVEHQVDLAVRAHGARRGRRPGSRCRRSSPKRWLLLVISGSVRASVTPRRCSPARASPGRPGRRGRGSGSCSGPRARASRAARRARSPCSPALERRRPSPPAPPG